MSTILEILMWQSHTGVVKRIGISENQFKIKWLLPSVETLRKLANAAMS